MTPAQKARATREATKERSAVALARSKMNAPIRAAWKDLRTMIVGLGARLRPRDYPSRWSAETPERREAEIVRCLDAVRVYTLKWEQAKIDVREAKRKTKAPRVRKARAAR